MMARVEGMSLDALRAGPAWDWRLVRRVARPHRRPARRERRVPRRPLHHAPRRDGRRRRRATPPRPEQIAAMVALAHDAMTSGALGFSSSLGRGAHRRRRQPGAVARRRRTTSCSRWRAAVRDHEGTTLEFIAAMGEIGADRIELMTDMSLAAEPPAELEPARQPLADRGLRAAAHVVRPRHGAGRARRRAHAARPDAAAGEPRARGPPGLARRGRARPDERRRRGRRSGDAREAACGCGGSGSPRAGRDRRARAARDRRRARGLGRRSSDARSPTSPPSAAPTRSTS